MFKKLKFVIVVTTFLTFSQSLTAGIFVFFDYHHPLGLYGTVEQEYVTSNNYDSFYTVDCSGIGLRRCRFSLQAPTNPNDHESFDVIDSKIIEVQTLVETEIGNGSIQGSGSETLVQVNSDGSRTTYVLQWKYNEIMEGETIRLEFKIDQYEGLL